MFPGTAPGGVAGSPPPALTCARVLSYCSDLGSFAVALLRCPVDFCRDRCETRLLPIGLPWSSVGWCYASQCLMHHPLPGFVVAQQPCMSVLNRVEFNAVAWALGVTSLRFMALAPISFLHQRFKVKLLASNFSVDFDAVLHDHLSA